MANPFEKRATEYLREDTGFLSVVTSEPLHTFFEKPAKEGKLYDRLSMVIGTPGSGKTTIARLLKYETVQILLNNPNHSEYKGLLNALRKCEIIENSAVKIIGCRLPMESEYRDFWELPYNEDIKIGLVKSFLQARAMLSWIRAIQNADQVDLSSIQIHFRDGAQVAEKSLGGSTGKELFERAQEVERLIYEIGTALVPPSESQLGEAVTSPYHPFDAIEFLSVTKNNEERKLKPLVMLDDVHILHPDQWKHLVEWLAKREMKIARWMFMRLDLQSPQSVLLEELSASSGIRADSQIKKSREITHIWLQGNSKDRTNRRVEFRPMARNMADKYLRLMPIFVRQGIASFPALLSTNIEPISASNMQDLRKKVERFAAKMQISPKLVEQFRADVDNYFLGAESTDRGEDVRWAMIHIMLHRYINRIPQGSLFDQVGHQGVIQPSKPINVKSGLAEGARLFLYHQYNRPYYYGINAVCDGSSENAEQFLQLAGELVKASETRIIQSKEPYLEPSYQHSLLVTKSEKMVKEWSFPRNSEVKKLCKFIAEKCLEKSLEPNASLDAGANAFGIPQEEFENIPVKYPDLAKTLLFGVAYNAISIKLYHSTKNRQWSLIELSGPVLISSGLTLARGGFLEKTVDDLLLPFKENKNG